MNGRPAWLLLADCVNRPDLDWFSDSPAGIAAAKAVCAGCPVLSACLSDAVARGEAWGVFGGLAASERRTFAVGWAPGTAAGYKAGGCRCVECRRAHALDMAEWRARAPVTRRPIVLVAVLSEPAGRGHSRAWPGQMFIEIGQAA